MNAGIDIRALVPHAGTMCLLDTLDSWDGERVTLRTRSHARPDNPLRRNGRLAAICLCEYGAQAMAVHGALVGRPGGAMRRAGLLVSLRDVTLAVARVESLPGELYVEAWRLVVGAGGLQYRFRVSHAGHALAQGRATVLESRS
jgi:predicted hotdog family 3-hydroxylacyl-ACP dehydratase